MLFRARQDCLVRIGKLGEFEIRKGYYVYVGSALGAGGLKARVGRHLRREKKLKWHVDHLRKELEIVDVFCHVTDKRMECVWTSELVSSGGTTPIPGFGASDCSCVSHLIYFEEPMDIASILAPRSRNAA